MKTIEEIKLHFENRHQDSIQALEQKRKNVKIRLVINILIVVGLLVASSLYFNTAKYFIGILILFLGVISIRRRYSKAKAQYSLKFQEEIVKKLIGFIDERLKYQVGFGISEEVFVESGITREKVDRYRSNDYFEGEIDGVPICFSEVFAENYDSSDGGRYYMIFKGIFFRAEFPKNFESRTAIYPDVLGGRMKGMSELFAKHSIAPDGSEKVNLEDPEFQKSFIVYSQDQVEARYILTTSMMERILKFKEKHNSFSMSFADNYIHIGLFSNKTLQPRLFGPIVNIDSLSNYIDTIQLTTDIVKDLKVNLNIYPSKIK